MDSIILRPATVFLLCCLALLCLAGPPPASQAQSGPKTAGQEDLPLNITANRLEVDQNQQVISFLQSVVARHKDVILYADVLKIFYQAKTEPPGDKGKKADTAPTAGPASPLGAVGIEKVTRIEALGGVKMVQGDRVATGDKAVFYTQEDKIVLMGNPQLWRGENSLKGREIVFYLKENRAVVEGSADKRVEAVIYPSQKVQLPGKPAPPTP